tara:strand:- start:156 stop:407 length:252 start_codon:yes stop_codon:yes gene_type:complete
VVFTVFSTRVAVAVSMAVVLACTFVVRFATARDPVVVVYKLALPLRFGLLRWQLRFPGSEPQPDHPRATIGVRRFCRDLLKLC